MTLAHLHLLLNHVPTVGTVIALALLLMSLIRRNEGMKRLGLELFCVIGLITVVTYVSGLGAQPSVEEMGADVEIIQRHHDAAFQGSVFMVLTGFVAWLGLWKSRRGAHASLDVPAVLLLSAITVALMARAANLGGEIRHPEILTPEAAASAAISPAWFTAGFWGLVVNEKVWLFPSMEVIHFIGLWVLFGVMIVVNARMLGLMRPASFPAVHRLLPWAALALTANIVTGMLFVLSNPGMYLHSYPFAWKMGLLLLAGATLLYQTVFEGAWHVGAGDRPPVRVKAVAASSLVLWIGVMYFGRMLPFLGDSF
jgi:uncharacterized membrane protein